MKFNKLAGADRRLAKQSIAIFATVFILGLLGISFFLRGNPDQNPPVLASNAEAPDMNKMAESVPESPVQTMERPMEASAPPIEVQPLPVAAPNVSASLPVAAYQPAASAAAATTDALNEPTNTTTNPDAVSAYISMTSPANSSFGALTAAPAETISPIHPQNSETVAPSLDQSGANDTSPLPASQRDPRDTGLFTLEEQTYRTWFGWGAFAAGQQPTAP
jgi:hypothetical protein